MKMAKTTQKSYMMLFLPLLNIIVAFAYLFVEDFKSFILLLYVLLNSVTVFALASDLADLKKKS